MISYIEKNLNLIKSKIHYTSNQHKLASNNILLVAVSKTFPAHLIRMAYQANQFHFAENYIQEAVQKINALQDIKNHLIWHFIGIIQSNKTKYIANYFHWVHTLDRIKIAERLNNQRSKNFPKLQVCVQINISNDRKKGGILTEDAEKFCVSLLSFENLELRGLMSIPKISNDFKEIQGEYKKLRILHQKISNNKILKKQTSKFNILSIGTSKDFEVAIAEGSNILRIGEKIFDQRTKK